MRAALTVLAWVVVLGAFGLLVTGVVVLYVDAGSAIATEACP